MVVDQYYSSQESLKNLKELRKTLAELKSIEDVHESGKSVDANIIPSPHSSTDPLDDMDAYLDGILNGLVEEGLVFIDSADNVALTELGNKLMSKMDVDEVLEALEKLEDRL